MKFKRSFIFVLFLGIVSILPASTNEAPYLAPWVPSEFAANSPKPLPSSGSCTAGTPYTITSVKDLYADIGQLECIFAAGVAPEKEPLGYSYGYLLAAANTAFYDLFAEIFYQGDFTVRTQCSEQYYTIGWLSIGGVKPGTAIWSVNDRKAALGVEVAEGEYPLSNENAIIMDFTQNFKQLCGAEGNESPLGLIGFTPFKNSVWPLNQFIDIAVVVGKDSDGGLISLNKAYIIPRDPEDGAATILFYATKSFDPDVLPSFEYEQQISVPTGPSGESTIEYYRGSVEALLQRLNPARIAGDYSEGYLVPTATSRSSQLNGQAKGMDFPITGLIDTLFRSSEDQSDTSSLVPEEFLKVLNEMNVDVDSLREAIEGGEGASLDVLLKRLENAGVGVDRLNGALRTGSPSTERFTAALGKAGVDLEKLIGALNVVDVPAGDVLQARDQIRSAIQSTIARNA